MPNKSDDLKEKVSDIIDHAVDTGDFTNMSREIGNIIKDAALTGSDVLRDMAAAGANALRSSGKSDVVDGTWTDVNEEQGAVDRTDYRNVKGYQPTEPSWRQRAYLERHQEQQLAPYFMPPAGAIGQRVISILLGAIGVLWGAVAVFLLLVFLGGVGFYALSWTLVFAALSGVHWVLALRFAKKATLLERFNNYRKIIGAKLYCDVRELSDRTYLSREEIRKDLKELTKRGLIRQGHFDRTENCFIASDMLYDQYLISEQNMAIQKAKEAEKEKETKQREKEQPEVQKILDEGNRYIEAIHKANAAIPGADVSAKLDETEHIVRRIFEEVEKKPELAGRLNTFMDYYLPTTIKLVTVYAELNRKHVQGENVESARREIEDSLDVINKAFANLLDSFFKDQAIDVSSDISVMKTMLKQEGLTEDELTAQRRRAKKTNNPFEKYESTEE